LLAAGADEDLGAYIAQARATPGGLRDPDALRREIAVSRQRGYSIDDGESSPGVRCLAVAIRGADERPLFAISLTGPSGRFTEERLAACVPEMLAVARSLTVRFGGEVAPAPEAVA
jgi:DNA-binding IclR family transcriptional regulator